MRSSENLSKCADLPQLPSWIYWISEIGGDALLQHEDIPPELVTVWRPRYRENHQGKRAKPKNACIHVVWYRTRVVL